MSRRLNLQPTPGRFITEINAYRRDEVFGPLMKIKRERQKQAFKNLEKEQS